MTKPITMRRIKYNWTKHRKMFKFLIFFNFVLYGFLVIGGASAYREYKNSVESDLRATETAQVEVDRRADLALCTLKDVVCKDTGDILIDALDGTPMEAAIEPIRKAAEFYNLPVELFLGIANAESSFRNFKNNNPFGIGVGGPRGYTSLEHAVNGFGQMMRYYYFNEGKDSPEKIALKYVGWNNKHWVPNVRKYWNPESQLSLK